MRSLALCSLALSIVVMSVNCSVASVITFTGGTHGLGGSNANPGDLVLHGTPYTEDGFMFDVSSGGNAFLTNGGGSPGDALGFDQPATILLTGPTAKFTLNSLQFASFGGLGIDFSVLGNLFGGGTISQQFSTQSGYDSASFGTGWTDLASVQFSSTSGGQTLLLDAVNVTSILSPAAVPEPATTSIIGLGTMIGAFCQYRRRKRAATK